MTPIDAVESVLGERDPAQLPMILLTPQGERFDQQLGDELLYLRTANLEHRCLRPHGIGPAVTEQEPLLGGFECHQVDFCFKNLIRERAIIDERRCTVDAGGGESLESIEARTRA